MQPSNKDLKFFAAIFLMSLAYFVIRVGYWNSTSEIPFSDMDDYIRISKQIVTIWDFSHTLDFWHSYKPPTLPLFLALYYKFRGSFELDFWPLFQTLFNFVALLFLARVLYKNTKNKFFPVLLIFTFSFSTSSVFWSLKPATEYFSETFLIFICAFTIYSFQKRTLLNFFVLGVFSLSAIFLRPQFLPILLVIPIALCFSKASPKKIGLLVFTFFLGSALTWLPWGLRAVRLYGHPIFTSTQGPYSFLWELGDLEIKLESGELLLTNVSKLQIEAPQNFKSDYDAMVYASKISKLWLKQHFDQYLGLLPFRIWNSASDKSEYLTKVPRNELFPRQIDWILLDKSEVFVVSGLLGMLLSLWIWPILWPLALLPISQWALGFCFLSYPRIIDPALPFIYFGNVLLVVGINRLLRRKRELSPCNH